jgi:hypothetical protein
VTDADGKPPYEAYAAIAGALVGGLGVVAALARRSPPATPLDLVALSAATFKASRTLSRERVASFLREPFVEGQEERPAGEGLQRAIGELVTCTRCVGTWSAAALASTQMLTRASAARSRGRSPQERRATSSKRGSRRCTPR